MQNKKWLALVLAVIFAAVLFAGCGTSGGNTTDTGSTGGDTTATAPPATSGTAPDKILIGIPNPTTGALASFGIGSPWAENLIVDYVNNTLGGIYIKDYDKKIPIAVDIQDTNSDSNKAAEIAQTMIDKDGVTMLIARHTPGTALPVSATAEKNSIPCVSLECPVESWEEGGPYTWVYHSFWQVADCCDMYMAMWQQLGFGPGTKVGFLFPNDPDGLAWQPIFTQKLTDAGYIISDPGQYDMPLADWTNVITQFKKDGVQVITGCDIAPDFQAFVTQAAQQNFKYEFATMGRAILFPADANVIPPDLANGLTCEVWWSPWHPWVSALTGETCQDLASAYEQETGIGWSAPMGYKYAGMEIAVDALTRAASLDPAAIRDAIGATDLDTMVGHIKYDPTTHVAPTPIVGGQWKLNADGSAVELQIVYNQNNPNIPTTASLELPSIG